MSAHVPGELADDLEAHLVGPVEVVEDEHRRPVDRLQDPVGDRPGRSGGAMPSASPSWRPSIAEEVRRQAVPKSGLSRIPDRHLADRRRAGPGGPGARRAPPSTRSPAASALRTAARIRRVLPSPAWPARNRRPAVPARRFGDQVVEQVEEVVAADDDGTEHRARRASWRAVYGRDRRRASSVVRPMLPDPRSAAGSAASGDRTIEADAHPRHDPPGAQGAPPRPSRRRPAAGDGRRPRRASSATTGCRRPTSTSWRRGSGAAPIGSRSSSTSRRSPTRSASCRSATRSSGSPPSAPRTSPRTASSTPRSATRPELSTERGPDPRRGRRGEPRGVPDRDGAGGRGRPPDRDEDARRPRCARPPARSRSPSARSAGATPASSGSTSPGPRRATRRPATSTRSTGSGARTSTSRSTPASRSGCRRSGRRSSSAARSGSATASGSSTTSRSATTARSSSAGWPRSSATGACRSRCARPRTSTPAPRPRSPSTRSTSSAGSASGSRSTPTTG